MKDRNAPALFGIVVYDGVEPIDIGGTVGVISMARRVLPAIESVTIAEKSGPVELAGGLTILAQAGFADAPVCDVVMVCGGPGWRRETANPAMLNFLRHPPAAQVTSVCTGAMILGAAGLLDGRIATTRRSAVGSEAQSPLAELASFAPDSARSGGGCGGRRRGRHRRRGLARDRRDALSDRQNLRRGRAGRGRARDRV